MDLTALEKDIALGLAMTVRAQQLAGPTLDRLIPGMIGERERQQLQQAGLSLLVAAESCRFAMESFTAAYKTLGAFTRLAGTDNSTSPDSKQEPGSAE